MKITKLNLANDLWLVSGKTNSYLIVRNNNSLLLDCGEPDMTSALLEKGIPRPSVVLHTQVQAEHCLEWEALPEAEVYVCKGEQEIALLSDLFYQDCKTVWPPARDWEERGEEKYGVAGSITVRPPLRPLKVAGTLCPGEQFTWQGISLEIINLSASGKHAIGFWWEKEKLLFAGDLLKKGGYLVNFYDLERSYGIPSAFQDLHDSLVKVSQLAPKTILPTSGRVIDTPLPDVEKLQQRIRWINSPVPLGSDKPQAMINYKPAREFGRYREVAEGIYQNNNSGNIILFVDRQGRGLIVDPDFCVWEDWEENCRELNADFDLLEKETNLQSVELLLVTHYHGDHVEYANLLRERYGAKLLATPDVAEIMEHPEKYPYPAEINWYGFPFSSISVDQLIKYNEPIFWNDIEITPVHTPGHCNAHTGFSLQWGGLKVFCTGDTLQYGEGPVFIPLPVIYNDTAWPDRGYALTYARIAAFKPDLVLCGHSFSFFDQDGSIMQILCLAAGESQKKAFAMVDNQDLLTAMTPPGYDKIRPVAEVVI